MSFYIEDSENESDYESDIDNIYNDNDNISLDENESKQDSFFGISVENIIKNDNFDWLLKRFICFEENIIETFSNPSFNNKKIKSEDIFECKICSQCNKRDINTTFCCLVRNESYYFCDSDCWSLWINKKKSSNENVLS